MDRRIQIIIADDQDIAREGMRRILSNEQEFEIIGVAAILPDVIQKVRNLKPDILLIDLQWLGDEIGGIETIRQLTQEIPETKIIAITVYRHLIEPARNAGAKAAVTKDIPMRQLIEEIKGIHHLPPTPDEIKDNVGAKERLTSRLTQREIIVLRLLAEGKSDKEISRLLGISESTAKNHVSNILHKLETANRASAVAIGYQMGLIQSQKS